MPEARRFSAPSRDRFWIPILKQYPHFDAPISILSAWKLVQSPTNVAKHEFLPFLRFVESWQPFRRKKGSLEPKPDPKNRTIRYASHKDSILYSYYRFLLSNRYEQALNHFNLSQNVIAYRRLLDEFGRGKSNINFAHEAFRLIESKSSCIAVALDISGFFDSLDHDILKQKICSILGTKELPTDWGKVVKNITQFADVDRNECYVALGYGKWTATGVGRKFKLTIPKKKIPIQLCTLKIFREKIAGKSGSSSLLQKNKKGYGIPQGAPISDLLANLYLLEFDISAKKFADRRNGHYLRYSDDILFVIPTGDNEVAADIAKFAEAEITRHGNKLLIKPEKTQSYRYYLKGNRLNFETISGSAKNGLQYLGFRYDGQHAYVKDATLSRLYRKISLGARQAAHSQVVRFPNRSYDELVDKFDFGGFLQKFGRVGDFKPNSKPRTWTFWTYIRRTKTIMGDLGGPLDSQLSQYRQFAVARVKAEILRALQKRQETLDQSL
ncbi:MAG: hypothetical protein JWR84_3445 [Caulobacter sp.]|nr:hypothetical protein [Caulobacter sp.]